MIIIIMKIHQAGNYWLMLITTINLAITLTFTCGLNQLLISYDGVILILVSHCEISHILSSVTDEDLPSESDKSDTQWECDITC